MTTYLSLSTLDIMSGTFDVIVDITSGTDDMLLSKDTVVSMATDYLR